MSGFIRASAAILASIAVCFPANTQTNQQSYGPQPPVIDYDFNERIRPNVGLAAHDFSLLGDSIDPFTGQLSFETVDVSLPGNFDLPVEIRRRLNPAQTSANEFHDWQLLAPSISTKIMMSASVGEARWAKTRCSKANEESIPTSLDTTANPPKEIEPSKYSDGVLIDIPGYISEQVLDRNNSGHWPADAKKVTKSHWYLTCLNNVDGHGAEGFKAHSPNGDVYTFDKPLNRPWASFVHRWSENVTKYEIGWQGTVTADGTQQTTGLTSVSTASQLIGVRYDGLRASKVEDRSGNWVKYEYDSWGRLRRVHASDGREISVEYEVWGATPESGLRRVRKIVVNPGKSSARTWEYSYKSNTTQIYMFPETVGAPARYGEGSGTFLHKVTLPDARKWIYETVGMQAAPIPGIKYLSTTCKQAPQSVSVTHPDGTLGEFEIREFQRPLNYRHISGPKGPACPNTKSGSGPNVASDIMAVTQKTLRVPGGATSVWQYNYRNGLEPPYGSVSDWSSLPNDNDLYHKTLITRPDGSIKEYKFHYDDFRFRHTKPTVKSVYSSGGYPNNPISTTNFTYKSEEIWPGSTFTPASYEQVTPILTTQKSVSVDGNQYTTKIDYHSDRSQSNYGFSLPYKLTESGANGSRVTDFTYEHKKSKWVIGLLKRKVYQGREYAEYFYDSLGRPIRLEKFNQVVGHYSYHTGTGFKGALYRVTNALGDYTQLTNYKRGIPQTIRQFDGTTISQAVNDNGWLISQTDPLGVQTGYQYTPAGWLKKIDRPAPFADTVIHYVNLGKSNFYQHVFTGRRGEVTWYDGLRRPTRTRLRSTEGDTPSAHVKYAYDAAGRQTFQSISSTSANPTDGAYTTYDALGRVTKVRDSVTGAETRTRYLSGGRTEVTDPLGNVTNTYVHAYGSPNNSEIVRIDQPMNLRSEMTYDQYGNMTSLKQRNIGSHNGYSVGAGRFFWYDARNRLCRHRAPEVGDELYRYDQLDRLQYKATGLPAGNGCAMPPESERTRYNYDPMGRTTYVNYPNGTPDIQNWYNADGTLIATRRGTAPSYNQWNYRYDAMKNTTRENAFIDGRRYLLDYTYSPEGDLSTMQTPWVKNISFNPNGLGQPRHLKVGSTTYASGTNYHVSGQLTNLNLNNGHVYTGTIDNRRHLLTRAITAKGTYKAYDFSYHYDAKLPRLTYVNDNVDGSFSKRNMQYDALGRLTYAYADAWGGHATFKYDALGNLRQKRLGNRYIDINYDPTKNRPSMMKDTANGNNWRGYNYDTRGNVIWDGRGGNTFYYDHSNQPVHVHGDATSFGPTGFYTYDGNLKRLKSDVEGRTSYHLYSTVSGNVNVVDTVSPTAVKKTYLRLGPVTARFNGGTFVEFIHTDHQGSSVVGTNSAGNRRWWERYTPFGESLNANDNAKPDVEYTGHVKDRDTDLTYMQARYFDPVIGRFHSTDPIDYADQMNLYAYVGNDPINAIDPNGEEITCNGTSGDVTCYDSITDTAYQAQQVSNEVVERVDGYVELEDVPVSVDDAVTQTQHNPFSALVGAAGNNVSPDQRYILTEDGWVDLKHVVSSTMSPGAPVGVSNLTGAGVEVVQLFTHPESAFKAEDFRSNAIGGEVAAEYIFVGGSNTIGQITQGAISKRGALTGAQALLANGFTKRPGHR